MKRKILWFTADFFIDVDRQLVPYLKKTANLKLGGWWFRRLLEQKYQNMRTMRYGIYIIVPKILAHSLNF